MAAPVVVAGGTGNVGKAVIKALSLAGVPTRVLTRSPESEASTSLATLPSVSVVKIDLADPTTLAAAFEGARAAFISCSNTKQQIDSEKNFINAAASAPTCEYLVKVGTCGVEGYTSRDSTIEYGRFHAEIEEYLASSTLKWTVLRPNYFMQNHMGDIFGTLPKNLIVYPMPPNAQARMIDTRDIGDVAAALLKLEDASGHSGRFYDVCGPDSLSTEALAKMYSEATGRGIVAVQSSREDYAKAAQAAGFPDWLAEAVALGMEAFWGAGKMDYPSSAEVLELCPPKRTMKQWIDEHIALSPPPAE
mmetsp:Transcript_6352/g.15684  ORF Transcript_6352/g.15684 Transcript_6352/m.15684 type:complete len:305 (-) Transcript_6352:171-1085(-)